MFKFFFFSASFPSKSSRPLKEEENRAVPAGLRVNVFYGFLLLRSSGTRDPTAGNFSRAVLEKTLKFLVFWPHVEPDALLLLGIMVWRLPTGCPVLQGGANNPAVASAGLVRLCFLLRWNPERVSSLTFDLSDPYRTGDRSGCQPRPDWGGRLWWSHRDRGGRSRRE